MVIKEITHIIIAAYTIKAKHNIKIWLQAFWNFYWNFCCNFCCDKLTWIRVFIVIFIDVLVHARWSAMVINNNNAYIVNSNFRLLGVLRVDGPVQSNQCRYSCTGRLFPDGGQIQLNSTSRRYCWFTSLCFDERNKYFWAFDVFDSVRLVRIYLHVRLFAYLVFTTFSLTCLLICVCWGTVRCVCWSWSCYCAVGWLLVCFWWKFWFAFLC